jgi:hypothetical protein
MHVRLISTAAALVLVAVLPADAQPRGRARGQTRQDARIRFQQMDRNHDRVIARSEWVGSEQEFRTHDWDGDGVLSGAEVSAGAEHDRLERFVGLDRDRDGAISLNEWDRPRPAFERRDLNRDGRITPDEFSAPAAIGTSGRRSAAYDAGFERGAQEGRAQAREDRVRNQPYDVEGQRELETADSGYDTRFGPKAEYQAGYRAGWRSGYPEGWRQP